MSEKNGSELERAIRKHWKYICQECLVDSLYINGELMTDDGTPDPILERMKRDEEAATSSTYQKSVEEKDMQ